MEYTEKENGFTEDIPNEEISSSAESTDSVELFCDEPVNENSQDSVTAEPTYNTYSPDETSSEHVINMTETKTETRKKPNNTVKAAIVAALIICSGVIGGYTGATIATNKITSQVVEQPGQSTTVYNTVTTYNDMSTARAKASASVVTINIEEEVTSNYGYGWYQNYSYTQQGSGSGVILSEDGYILTCSHVVEDATKVTVVIGEKEYDAQVVGYDELSDIAVIKIEPEEKLTPATLGDSDSLLTGNGVMTIGNPLGLLSNSVSSGIVSAINRDITVGSSEMTLIQTDASVSPGNSGGGLFDLNGNLVGIVNAKYSDEDVEGIGFAIPINTAMKIADELINDGYVSSRATLGVTVVTSNNSIYIYSVVEGSAADEAGLQKGDRIVAVDGTELSSASDLTNYIAKCEPGQEIKLTLVRDRNMYEVTAILKSAATTYETTNQA